jgi:hypothetical protein
MGIGVVDILDVDVFGGATDAIVCLDVNACCINVVVGIKGDVVATECCAKGLFSSSVSATTKATTNNIASNLTANNLTIKTTKEDINITGSGVE